MEHWTLKFSRLAIKDSYLLKDKGLEKKVQELLKILKENPYQNPPPFEKLWGFPDAYSRRINVTHRLVYRINKELGVIEVVSMFRHYR